MVAIASTSGGPIRFPSHRGVGQVCDPPCILGRPSTHLSWRDDGNRHFRAGVEALAVRWSGERSGGAPRGARCPGPLALVRWPHWSGSSPRHQAPHFRTRGTQPLGLSVFVYSSTNTSPPRTATPVGAQGCSAFRTVSTSPSSVIYILWRAGDGSG